MMSKPEENRWQFVATEISLGFTFIKSAQLAYSMGHLEHGEGAQAKAEAAYRGAQRFIQTGSGHSTDALQKELERLRTALHDLRASRNEHL